MANLRKFDACVDACVEFAQKKCKKKLSHAQKKKNNKNVAGFEPASFCFAAQYPNHSATLSSSLMKEKLIPYINTAAQIWRKFGVCVDACAKFAQIVAQLRQLRQNLRRPVSLRLKKSLYCASYKGFPAAGSLLLFLRRRPRYRPPPPSHRPAPTESLTFIACTRNVRTYRFTTHTGNIGYKIYM